MRFFEFNDYPYYALIGADDEVEAVEFYQEVVLDYEDDGGLPGEITEDEARDKLNEACEGDYLKMTEFEQDAQSSEPFLILIDDDLA